MARNEIDETRFVPMWATGRVMVILPLPLKAARRLAFYLHGNARAGRTYGVRCVMDVKTGQTFGFLGVNKAYGWINRGMARKGARA